jgi:hypothetical protein
MERYPMCYALVSDDRGRVRLEGLGGPMPSAIMAVGLHRDGGNVTRPRAADDFAAIRARLEELRLERDRALVGQKTDSGSGSDRATASEDEGQGERRLPRSAILRKIVR